jgi:hypothetical protein
MKQGDYVLKGSKHYNDYLFSFSTSEFQSFFISRMSIKEFFCGEITKTI